MFLLRHMFMHSILCAVYVRVTSEWIPYNGFWYYISNDNDKLTYQESAERCKLLQGRLAVLSGYPDDRNKLASFTGSTRRWIYGYHQRVIYESEGRYVLDYPNAYNKYGYICDWQCHSLGVYSQALHNDISDSEERRDTLYDLIPGLFDLYQYTRVLRQPYVKQPLTNSTWSTISQKWPGGTNNHIWCFRKNDEYKDYICKLSPHFTPSKDPNLWKDVDTSESVLINFFCHDCDAFEVSLHPRDELTTMSDTLYKVINDAKMVYVNADNNKLLEYDSHTNQWCLNWTHYLDNYCFDYIITPTVDHVVVHVSSDLSMLIWLSCTTNTIPIQQSTEASVERDTTSEIHSMVTNSHIQTDTTATFDDTNKEPRSANVDSDKKTIIYIAVGCAIDCVVIIIIIPVAVVFCRRRKENKKNDDEHNIQSNVAVPGTKCSANRTYTNFVANAYSSLVVNDINNVDSGQQYEQIKSPSTEYANTAVDDGYLGPSDNTILKTNHGSAKPTENVYSSLAVN